MKYKITYQEDTELAEMEALHREYRGDVVVQIEEKEYKLYFTTMLRLQQDFDTEQEEEGLYMPEANIIILKTITKKGIEQMIEELYKGKYFESLERYGF